MSAPPPAFATLTARFVAGVLDAAIVVAASVALQRFLSRLPAPTIDVTVTVLSAAYFILAYGPVGKGYSLGKRALAIRVVNGEGAPLSILASAVRWTILVGIGLPITIVVRAFASGHPLGVARAMEIVVPIAVIVVADSYLFLFNRRTRQSLHDLAARSYVVRRAHAGPPPHAPLWRAHYAWVALACVTTAAVLPAPYAWLREIVPRSAELLRARERIVASQRVTGLLVSPGFATQGSDTTWYVSMFGHIKVAPRTEREAEAMRFSLACALAREAPRALHSAEVYVLVSFDPGAVATSPSAEYIADTDLTKAACASARAIF